MRYSSTIRSFPFAATAFTSPPTRNCIALKMRSSTGLYSVSPCFGVVDHPLKHVYLDTEVYGRVWVMPEASKFLTHFAPPEPWESRSLKESQRQIANPSLSEAWQSPRFPSFKTC